jgi:hypothetical protein
MATDLITGIKGSAHVTSSQQREINACTFGTGAYILDGCAATLPSANTCHIAAGFLMVQGAAVEVSATDLTIDNGSQGTKRHDLICLHYTLSGGVESASLIVVKGTGSSAPADPTVTGSILSGDATADIPLWRVSLDGITPTVAEIAQSGTVHPLASMENALIASIGSSGGWDYIKYASGRCELDGSITVSAAADSWTAASMSFPFALKYAPTVTCSRGSDGSCWSFGGEMYVDRSTSGVTVNMYQTSAASVVWCVHVVGYWE